MGYSCYVDINAIKRLTKFNSSKTRSFRRRFASKSFLEPIGLQISKPPPSSYEYQKGQFSGIEQVDFFRAYHYLKWRYTKKREPNTLRLLIAVRNRIFTENKALVKYCMQKSLYITDRDEMFSNTNMALLRAIDGYDPWKGHRFSTYACYAILREIHRKPHRKVLPKSQANIDDLQIVAEEPDLALWEKGEKFQQIMSVVYDGLLSKTERFILISRFLWTDPKTNKRPTLEDIGTHVGLSKERIRQIQNASIKKIQKALDSGKLIH